MAQESHKWTKGLCGLIIAATTYMGTGNAIADDAVLKIEGTCPGQVRISWREAIPNRQMGVVFGLRKGVVTIPLNLPCGGTVIGVAFNVRPVARLHSGPDGEGMAAGRASQGFCGGFIQLVIFNVYPCQVSSVVQVPE